MEFQYNRDKQTVINVLKRKAEKKNLKVDNNQENVEVSLESGKFQNGEDYIPVTFKGKISDDDSGSVLKGGFYYGFYLYTLVIVAAILIVARFAWSVIEKQMGNIILCGIVTVLLAIVVIVVMVKSKKAKEIILDCLNDLNVKS